jgi:hypothetical protein
LAILNVTIAVIVTGTTASKSGYSVCVNRPETVVLCSTVEIVKTPPGKHSVTEADSQVGIFRKPELAHLFRGSPSSQFSE